MGTSFLFGGVVGRKRVRIMNHVGIVFHKRKMEEKKWNQMVMEDDVRIGRSNNYKYQA